MFMIRFFGSVFVIVGFSQSRWACVLERVNEHSLNRVAVTHDSQLCERWFGSVWLWLWDICEIVCAFEFKLFVIDVLVLIASRVHAYSLGCQKLPMRHVVAIIS